MHGSHVLHCRVGAMHVALAPAGNLFPRHGTEAAHPATGSQRPAQPAVDTRVAGQPCAGAAAMRSAVAHRLLMPRPQGKYQGQVPGRWGKKGWKKGALRQMHPCVQVCHCSELANGGPRTSRPARVDAAAARHCDALFAQRHKRPRGRSGANTNQKQDKNVVRCWCCCVHTFLSPGRHWALQPYLQCCAPWQAAWGPGGRSGLRRHWARLCAAKVYTACTKQEQKHLAV
jgi:hypothetical protein